MKGGSGSEGSGSESVSVPKLNSEGVSSTSAIPNESKTGSDPAFEPLDFDFEAFFSSELESSSTTGFVEAPIGKNINLKALQHELACKKLELKEKAKKVGNDVGDEAGQFSQPDKEDNKPCNTKGSQVKSSMQLDYLGWQSSHVWKHLLPDTSENEKEFRIGSKGLSVQQVKSYLN
ncbi:unnamed protein product [Dovyalis caffra]|uniref:Uncharacterized protein n=1 Tax=Dovyalis caffra TaxID=77055 RepID=A0AAV1QPT6_9ROSI|nr:unnamed protein product [Dovyalis caffra]